MGGKSGIVSARLRPEARAGSNTPTTNSGLLSRASICRMPMAEDYPQREAGTVCGRPHQASIRGALPGAFCQLVFVRRQCPRAVGSSIAAPPVLFGRHGESQRNRHSLLSN